MNKYTLLVVFLVLQFLCSAQPSNRNFTWSADGNSTIEYKSNQLIQTDLLTGNETVLVSSAQLKPEGSASSIRVSTFTVSKDQSKFLIFTNTAKVWRYNTRGDYWILDKSNSKLWQLGKTRPAQSLMFAKLSPDGTKVAYVSEKNIYVEDLASGTAKQLTLDGSRKLINGTFDWVYEEELDCRDGFRWSPDSKSIAYWQVDANDTRNFYMLNNTDSIYPRVIPVEYPKAGEKPSAVKIGVINIETAATTWMKIPGDPRDFYLTRMDWAANPAEIMVQQLNRRQNESKLYICNIASGDASSIYEEKDNAWIDVSDRYVNGNWDWLGKGKDFLWTSDKDGWRHIYRISRDGKKEVPLTPGKYDIVSIEAVDEPGGYVYYFASPDNATQLYLYRSRLDGKGKSERVSPANEQGTNRYKVSANGKFAWHGFTNYYTPPVNEWITLPDHKALRNQSRVNEAIARADKSSANIEFFKIKTEDSVEMDAWMVKPANFDPAKKYPVVFFVYTEPAGANVQDEYGAGDNFLYKGDMSKDGYFYISIDNRGTPVPKGAAWRKSIYRKIGMINIRDQAMAAKEILKWKYLDTSRVAVWGWSGGGSATLNLMFQYPDIYKTGIAVSAVANMLTYDNIYQERYMGIPQETKDDYIKGSPITYAKNLKGNLLYIHGTGDDNVHYQNAELLLNELIKYNKQFQFMAYPNRTHSISEGPGTFNHLSTLYTEYLKKYCPPGPR